jgi:hypothetical protein
VIAKFGAKLPVEIGHSHFLCPFFGEALPQLRELPIPVLFIASRKKDNK